MDDYTLRQHHKLAARAERLGYDGDIADLYEDQDYHPAVDVRPEEPGWLVALAGSAAALVFLVALLIVPAVQR